jgi:DNA-directed RNA polymerase subunit M/transcription elongation factor TFIIS
LDLPIILLGILLGLILAIKEIGSPEKRRVVQRSDAQSSSSLQNTPPRLPSTPTYPPASATFSRLDDSVANILRDAAREAHALEGAPRPIPPHRSIDRRAGNDVVDSKNLLENWRRSIIGLVRLAESNLQVAKSQAAMMNHKAAAELAATSVENVSRALLHCYGEKPDQNPGQEEPLKLLARRLRGEEKAQFERAIGEAVQLNRNRIVQAYLSEKRIQAPVLSEERTQQILETATKIVTQFREIIDEHFATEIPELDEKCPKCGALTVGLWTFGPQGSSYQCNTCGHRWILPTQ